MRSSANYVKLIFVGVEILNFSEIHDQEYLIVKYVFIETKIALVFNQNGAAKR
jgi:hypothetical protein